LISTSSELDPWRITLATCEPPSLTEHYRLIPAAPGEVDRFHGTGNNASSYCLLIAHRPCIAQRTNPTKQAVAHY